MKSYQIKQDYACDEDQLFLASKKMLVASIMHIDPQQNIDLDTLSNFKMKTNKGDFIINECDKTRGISYEISDAHRKDVTQISWLETSQNQTTLFYQEYGVSTSFWSRLMFWMKISFDHTSFDIKAKSILGSIKYYLESKGE